MFGFLGISLVLLFSGVGFPIEVPAKTIIQFRADHMVLESVTDGKFIFAATQNGRINCFNLKSGSREQDLLKLNPDGGASHPPAVFSVAMSEENRYLAASTSLGEVFIFDAVARQLLKKISVSGIENIPIVRFLDKERLILGLMDGTVRLVYWDMESEGYRAKIELDPVTNIRLSENRRLMAVTTGASTIKIISTADGKLVQELTGHKDTIYGLVFSRNRRLFSGSKDMTLRRWNLDTGSNEVLYRSSFYVNSVAWNSTNLIAFHLPEYQIGIMNNLTGKLIKQLDGHTAFINTLYFITPHLLMSSGNDARIIIHQI